ncbi:hypothetical protein E2P81_ATG01083 [Venturia nashicola]|nr:hypothetical protein E2P81_ATG01083 [Venturia nashicola]
MVSAIRSAVSVSFHNYLPSTLDTQQFNFSNLPNPRLGSSPVIEERHFERSLSHLEIDKSDPTSHSAFKSVKYNPQRLTGNGAEQSIGQSNMIGIGQSTMTGIGQSNTTGIGQSNMTGIAQRDDARPTPFSK